MSRRRELISGVLRQRFGEVCERVATLATNSDMAEFSTGVKQQLQSVRGTASPQFAKWTTPEGWLVSDVDCLTALRALTLDAPITTSHGEIATAEEFCGKLKSSASDAALQFELLTTRYCVPLNFLLPSEQSVREYVLERLMVQERARIEQGSIDSVSAEALLLKLNLISIQACCSTDLRFLDALNYYYELLPSTWQPQSRHQWLLISFLALYARALSWYC